MAKNYFDLISKFQNYFHCYYPPKQIKSAWYRFYFFVLETDLIHSIKCFSLLYGEIFNLL